MKPNERAFRWLRAPIAEAKRRANRIVLELEGYGGASEKLVAEARRVLDAFERITE